MNEIITIDGVRYKRIEEELAIAEEPKKSVFDCDIGDKYCYIDSTGSIYGHNWDNDTTDNALAEVANCCKDEKLMEQRALHEVLNRLLWRASVEAGELDNPWDKINKHYSIYCNGNSNGDFKIACLRNCKHNSIYFPTKESAQAAVDNIIKPFMKEHPDFEW